MTDEQVFIVCMPVSSGNPGGYDDNKYGQCAQCRVAIQWRPHSPEPSTKVCIGCALKDGEPKVVAVTPQTLEDLDRWRKGKL